MEQIMVVCNHLLSTSSVVVTEIDKVQFGVSEVDTFCGYVQCQAIRPIDFLVYD